VLRQSEGKLYENKPIEFGDQTRQKHGFINQIMKRE
jgi:hypothetical protein